MEDAAFHQLPNSIEASIEGFCSLRFGFSQRTHSRDQNKLSDTPKHDSAIMLKSRKNLEWIRDFCCSMSIFVNLLFLNLTNFECDIPTSAALVGISSLLIAETYLPIYITYRFCGKAGGDQTKNRNHSFFLHSPAIWQDYPVASVVYSCLFIVVSYAGHL